MANAVSSVRLFPTAGLGEQEALIMSSYLNDLVIWPVLLLLADAIQNDE